MNHRTLNTQDARHWVLTLAISLVFVGCSTTPQPIPPLAQSRHDETLSDLSRQLLERVGIRPEAAALPALEETPPLLDRLTPTERAAVLSELYLRDRSLQDPVTARDRVLRSAHYADEGLHSGECASSNTPACAALVYNYRAAVTLVTSDLTESGWTEGAPLGSSYDLRFNGDGGAIDINEWSITLLDEAPKHHPTEKLVGVEAVACRTEPRVNDEALLSTCRPVILSLSFEGNAGAAHTRAYLTALALQADTSPTATGSQMDLERELYIATWRALESRVRTVPLLTPPVRAHLGCLSEIDPQRLTTLIVLDQDVSLDPWAKISSTLTLDQSIKDRFNFCTYTDFSESVTPESVGDLRAVISHHLTPPGALLTEPRPARVAFVTQGHHSGELISSFRESIRRVSRSGPPAIETTGVFAVSPYLFSTITDKNTGAALPSNPVAAVAVAERDILRLLSKIVEQHSEASDRADDQPDFVLSPVM